MNSKIILTVLFFSAYNFVNAQLSGSQLLDKSIEFHDPSGNWNKFKGKLDFKVLWPDKPDGKRSVFIDNYNEKFELLATYKEGQLKYEVNKGVSRMTWDGSLDIPKEFSEKYKISEDRAILYRDYYTYLYGMPMKLKDEGSHVEEKTERVEFHDKEYLRMRVTYDPEIGKDIWYFYFDPNTFALEAYQFFHDEEANDGEYILFKELKEISGVRIPKVRVWYYNIDEKYLAADVLN